MAGVTVTALSNYTVEDKAELREKSIFGFLSKPYMTVYPGIKYSEKLPYVTTNPQMKADTGCSTHAASGDGGTWGQITLTVDPVRWEDAWCYDDLRTKYTKKYLKKGSKLDESTAPELLNILVNNMAGEIAKDMEIAVWQSSKTQNTFDTNLKQFNGAIQTLETVGGFINQQTVAGTAYTSITTANVITIFQNQWLSITADLRRLGNLVTVCGEDTFNKLVIALTNANLFHYKTDGSTPKYEMTLPGTGLKIVALPGLNSDNDSRMPAVFKNRILTYSTDQLYLGCDEESDLESTEVWFNTDEEKQKFRQKAKLTTGWFFPETVVSFATV